MTLTVGNPLNAPPVPAKQDGTARGCYVRLSAVVPAKAGTQYAVTTLGKTPNVRGYWIIRLRG
jgi:hypothetical protein